MGRLAAAGDFARRRAHHHPSARLTYAHFPDRHLDLAAADPRILGAGITLLPAYVCQAALATGALVHLLPDWTPAPYEMAMIFPSRENPSRAQLAFRDHVGAYDFSAFAEPHAGMPRG